MHERTDRRAALAPGRSGTVAALLFVAMLGGASLASADEASEARAYLEARHQQVRRLLSRPPGAARDRRLVGILRELLDLQAIAERALGAAWSERTEAERGRFVEVLGQLVERSYRKGLQRTLDYRVRTLGARTDGEDVVVQTEARSRRNRRAPPVRIDYRLRRGAQGRWRIVDIVTDGVSLTDNYRRQFRRVLRREGWQGLMKRLRQRLASSDSAG